MEFIDRTGMVEVYCRFIRKNGKIIYPKNGQYFHFWAKPKEKVTPKKMKTFGKDPE